MFFQAGSASVVITPGKATDLGGYAGRTGKSLGTHDDLYAKALVWEQKGNFYALITADLAGLSQKAAGRIKKKIRQQLGIPERHLVLACSHTHSGPTLDVFAGMGTPDSCYALFLEKRIVSCVQQALKSLAPACLVAGKGKVRININRCWPEGPVDEEISVLLVRSAEKPIARLVNYACHPVVLGRDNLFFSADYPGVVQTMTEKVLGGITLFTLGCCGDINPQLRGSFQIAEKLGQVLAGEVIRVESLLPQGTQPEIKMRKEKIFLPLHPPSQKQLKKILVESQRQENKSTCLLEKVTWKRWADWACFYLSLSEKKDLPRKIPVTLTAISTGETTLLFLPGEVFVEIGLKIKKESPFPHTVIVSCADGVVGYFPTGKVFCKHGYETDAAFIWYQNLPFSPRVEDTVIRGSLRLLKKVACEK